MKGGEEREKKREKKRDCLGGYLVVVEGESRGVYDLITLYSCMKLSNNLKKLKNKVEK